MVLGRRAKQSPKAAKVADASAPRPGGGAHQQRNAARALGSVSSLLMVAIVLMANYLGFRHYTRFDWTRDRLFTLSDKSKVVLRKLDKDVDIYLFLSRNEPNFADTDELLRRYRAASPRIRVHHVDPDREPAEFKMLAQRFGLGAALLADTGEFVVDVAAVVAAGDEKWSVKRDDLVGWDLGEPGSEEDAPALQVKAEQALTGAVVQVTGGRPTKVCLTAGHGEWTVDPSDERSLGTLKEALRHDNIEWESLDTLGRAQIAESCDAVFTIGPRRAFTDAEARLLADYVRGGGHLLLALDPVIERDRIQPTGLEEMAKGFGVLIDKSLVIELDRDRLLSPSAVEFLVTEFGDHETTRPLVDNARVLVGLARSVRPAEGSQAEILLRSSPKGFGETDISKVQTESEPAQDEGDVPGPVSVAVAVTAQRDSAGGGPGDAEDTSPGRLVVVGDADWLQGSVLGAPELANYHLASAWTGWLTQREALIAIPPKKASTGAVTFTQGDLGGLLFRIGVLLPGAALILGFAVWMNRRS